MTNISSSLLARCWCFLKEPQPMGEPWSSSNQVINHAVSRPQLQRNSCWGERHRGWRPGNLFFSLYDSILSVIHRHTLPFLFSLFSTFSPGAFLAGVPVQPVLLHYPNKLVGEVNGRKGRGQGCRLSGGFRNWSGGWWGYVFHLFCSDCKKTFSSLMKSM